MSARQRHLILGGLGLAVAAALVATPSWRASEAARAAETQEAAKPDPSLEAVALLAKINLYAVFGGLGVSADAFDAKAYDAKRIAMIVEDVIIATDAIVQSLENLKAADIQLPDGPTIDVLIEGYALLQREARLLVTHVKKPDSNDAAVAYRQARDESWIKVRKILGLAKEQYQAGRGKAAE